MPIGTIVDLPTSYSAYGRVRNEYGDEHTVHASEIPTSADAGDDFAYSVDIWQNNHGNVATLRSSVYGPG